MRNLVKYVGIGLLVMGLAACDDKDTNATAQGSVAESNATGNPVNLLDGKLSFSLPADMTDQTCMLLACVPSLPLWSVISPITLASNTQLFASTRSSDAVTLFIFKMKLSFTTINPTSLLKRGSWKHIHPQNPR